MPMRACKSSRTPAMLFACALLLDERQSAALKAALQTLSVAGGPLGLTYYLEGPRAPFSFF